MDDSYTITLKNCAFFAHHGVFEQEGKLGQRFFVDAQMEVEAGTALEDDDVAGTVDYGAAFKVIEQVVTGTRRRLIETLAKDVAKALCAGFPQILHVAVTVRKPSVPIPGILDHAEVHIEHSR